MVCYNRNPRGVSFESCRTHFLCPSSPPPTESGRSRMNCFTSRWSNIWSRGGFAASRMDDTDGAANGFPPLNSQGQQSRIVFYWFYPQSCLLPAVWCLAEGIPLSWIPILWHISQILAANLNMLHDNYKLFLQFITPN